MSDNVHLLGPHANMTVEQALSYVLKEKNELTEVLIIASTKEEEVVIRSSNMKRRDALWLAEEARLHALGIEK